MQYLDYQFGHDFGIGIDTVIGAIKGDAVVRTTAEDVTGAEGQTVVFAMEQIESTEQLSDSLSASAEVNARFGFISASAKFDFAKSTAVNRYSLYLLVSAVVTNSFRQMRDVRLTKEAADLWRSGESNEWRMRYGDAFCAGMSTGGVYYAILQIDTESEEEKDELSTQLEAGYGILGQGFNAQAQFSKMIERIASNKSLKVRHFQSGGSDSTVKITADNMIAKAVEFPPTVAGDKATPFNIMVKEYETVSNLPAQPNKFDLLLAYDVLNECGRLRLQYLDWINDIDYILTHPNQFSWTNERQATKQLGAKADELRKAITELARRASRCANNVSQCEMPSGEATVILDPDDIPERKRRKGQPKRAKSVYPFWAPGPLPWARGMWQGKRWIALGPKDFSVDRPQAVFTRGQGQQNVEIGKHTNLMGLAIRKRMNRRP